MTPLRNFFEDAISYGRSLLKDNRSYTPLIAFLAVILILAELPICWGMRLLSPGMGPSLDAMGRGSRILAFGPPTVSLLLALWVVPDFRRKRASGHLANVRMERATLTPITMGEDDVHAISDRLAELRRTEGSIPTAFVGVTEHRREWVPEAERFDANRYFAVFDRLKPGRGFRIDYVYESTGNGGRPLLYMRRESERPVETALAYRNRYPMAETDLPYLNGLSFEPSPTGYVQLAWYAIEAPLFYLHWHAGYARREVIGTQSRLEQIVGGLSTLAEGDRARALALDPRPVVKIAGSVGEVSLLTFSPCGGFILVTFRVVTSGRLWEVRRETRLTWQSPVRF